MGHIDLIVKAKSAAESRDMNSTEFDEEYDLDRSMRLKRVIEQVFEENSELLERLKDGRSESDTR
jgi:hypothetical protein